MIRAFLPAACCIPLLCQAEGPLPVLAGRTEDFVVLRGIEVPELKGVPAGQIRLYRWEEGRRFVSIPFQIDARAWNPATRDFRFVLSDDPGSSGSNRSLGHQDEIVFMAQDAGEQAPRSADSSGMHYGVELFDALRGQRGWIYVARERGVLYRSGGEGFSYIQYDPGKDAVETDRMRIVFDEGNPAFPKEAFVKTGFPASPGRIVTGAAVALFLDIKYFFNITLGKENFRSRLAAYKAGPVRLIRRVASEIKWGILRFRSDADSDFIFYRGRIEIPTSFTVPVTPGAFLAPASEAYNYIFLDRSATRSAKVVNSSGMPDMRIDGRQSPAEIAANGQPVRWWAILGEGWGVLSQLDWDTGGQNGERRSYFYFKDRSETDEADPAVGDSFRMVEFPKGRHRFTVHQYAGANVREQSLSELIANLESPLQITARPLQDGAARAPDR